MRNSGLSSTDSCFNFPLPVQTLATGLHTFHDGRYEIRKATKENGNRKISCGKWQHKERRSGEISGHNLPDTLETRINPYYVR
jgi:hypothetical protein